jgi:hypothetical protein
MLEILNVDGINTPTLYCDICGDPILEAGKAAIVFDNFRDNGERAKTLQVHKGKINGKTCHEEADSIIKSGGGTPGWMELKAYLYYLTSNIKFPPSEMVEYEKRHFKE